MGVRQRHSTLSFSIEQDKTVTWTLIKFNTSVVSIPLFPFFFGSYFILFSFSNLRLDPLPNSSLIHWFTSTHHFGTCFSFFFFFFKPKERSRVHFDQERFFRHLLFFLFFLALPLLFSSLHHHHPYSWSIGDLKEETLERKKEIKEKKLPFRVWRRQESQ